MQRQPRRTISEGAEAGFSFAATVADALLYQFNAFAWTAVDKGEIRDEAAYEKVLKGLEVSAPQVGPLVLEQLLSWRDEKITELNIARGDPLILVKKRLIIDILVQEAALKLTADDPRPHSIAHMQELAAICFDWILNGDRNVDNRSQPEIVRSKERLVAACSQLLGNISSMVLDFITTNFLNELTPRLRADPTSAQRQEIFNLCSALKYVRLHGDTPEQLRASTTFIERTNPLRHVAAEKKSRVQQAIAEMITAILAPLADAGDPGQFGSGCDPALRKTWFTAVNITRSEVFKWATKQSKQVSAGLPAAATLVCLEEDMAFVSAVDALVDVALKQLRDKKNSSLALLCLCRCVSCYLRRLVGRQDINQINKWLTKTVQPVIQSVCRGALTAPEHPELLRLLVCVIIPHLPELALQLILELLQSDGSTAWEAPMSGILSLLSMVCDAPEHAAGNSLPPELPPSTANMEAAAAAAGAPSYWLPSTESAEKLLEVIKAGLNPLDPYGLGMQTPRVAAAVGRVLTQCHTLHGYSRLTNSAKAVPDIGPRERLGALPVFIAVLHCVPFVIPDNWASPATMAEDLAGYSIHAEPAVRHAATLAFRRSIEALPFARDAMLGVLATFTVRITDDFPEVVQDTALLLLELLREWERFVPLERNAALGTGLQQSLAGGGRPPPMAHFDNLSKVEGAALGLLCSNVASTRRIAVLIADTARSIHLKLGIDLLREPSEDLTSAPSSSLNTSSVYMRASSSRKRLTSGSLSANTSTDLGPLTHSHAAAAMTVAGGHRRLSSFTDRVVSGHHTRRQSGTQPGDLGISGFAGTPPSLGASNAILRAGGEGQPGISPPAIAPGTYFNSVDDAIVVSSQYLADIIERSGDAIVARCYWDFGRWSDTWREWRSLPESGVTFMECLDKRDTPEDVIRWTRVLCEVSKEAWISNGRCAYAAHIEMTTKLQSMLLLDSSGRQALPVDGPKAELARNCCLLAAAAPLMDVAQLGETRGMTTRDFVRLLVNNARSGIDALQHASVLALGCAHPSYHSLVVQEAQVLIDDSAGPGNLRPGGMGGPGGRSMKARRDDTRVVHAHILRQLCGNLAPNALLSDTLLRDKILSFINDSLPFIQTTELSPDVLALRYCVANVSRAAAFQLAQAMPQAFPPPLRKSLFGTFAVYCEEGRTPGLFRSELRRSIAAARSKIKDSEMGRALETELIEASDALEHAAVLAMGAMLIGPVFDPELHLSTSKILLWITRLLSSPTVTEADRQQQQLPGAAQRTNSALWGPPRITVARLSLRGMLESNPDLAPLFVNLSYNADEELAATYFHVLAEVLGQRGLPALEPHIVLSLVLHKIVDPRPDVREAALGIMNVLSSRKNWRNEPGPLASQSLSSTTFNNPRGNEVSESTSAMMMSSVSEGNEPGAAVVVGSLAESQQQFQQYLSARMAQDHPDLSEALTLEILSRQRAAVTGLSDPQALLCLTPWLQYVHLGQTWEGQKAEGLLRALYTVTAKQGGRHAYPVQKLWSTLAVNRRNVSTALDFLIQYSLAESAAGGSNPCAVGKQAALYLSRVAPRQTIDYLVQEAARQLDEDEPPPLQDGGVSLGGLQQPSGAAAIGKSPDASRKILEFHHKPSITPTQQPLPSRQPLAAAAAAAVAAATNSSSKPLTPASIALAIKRTTVDKLIKTGLAVVDHVAAVPSVLISGEFFPSFGGGGNAGQQQTKTSGGFMGVGGKGGSNAAGGYGGFGTLSTSMTATGFGSGVPFGAPGEGLATTDTDPNKSASASNTKSTPPTPPPRYVLARHEVALSFLTEIACERDEELRQHLALLLHLGVLNADSTHQGVRTEAGMLLQCLLYSLACKHLESQGQGVESADYSRVSGVISYLQSLGEEALWPREQPTLTEPWVASAAYVAAFVQIVADCFYFDGGLRDRWSQEALRWACESGSHHAASRSHQVYCALGPQLSSLACTALLASLFKCLKSASAEGLDMAIEVLCTLRVLVTNTDPGKLILYPQLLAACAALLSCSVVRVGELAAALLIQLLDALDFCSPAAQQTTMAVLAAVDLDKHFFGDGGGHTTDDDDDAHRGNNSSSNSGGGFWALGSGLLTGVPDVDDDQAGGPWFCLQQLIIKALFQPDTEVLAFEVLTAVARQVSEAGRAGLLASRNPSGLISAGVAPGLGRNPRPSSGKSAGRGGTGGYYRAGTLERGLAAGYGSTARTAGVEAVLGQTEAGLAVSLSACLPWIMVRGGGGTGCSLNLSSMGGGDDVFIHGPQADAEATAAISDYLKTHAAACRSVGWKELGATLDALSNGFPGGNWLPDVAAAMSAAWFPSYSRIVVQRLMETVRRGLPAYQRAALAALSAIFKSPAAGRLSLGFLEYEGPQMIDTLTGAIGGPHGEAALRLLQAMAAHRIEIIRRNASSASLSSMDLDLAQSSSGNLSLNAKPDNSELAWPYCMDDLGEGNRLCTGALARAVAACPDGAVLLKGAWRSPPKQLRGGDGGGGHRSSNTGESANDVISPSDRLVPFLGFNSSGGQWLSTP